MMARCAVQSFWRTSLLNRKHPTVFSGIAAELPPNIPISSTRVPDMSVVVMCGRLSSNLKPASKSEISIGPSQGLCEAASKGSWFSAFRMQYPKLENILVGFEELSVLEDFAELQASNPMPRKSKEGNKYVYLSHDDFGHLRSYYILPKITDFGLAQLQKDASRLNRHPIQPDHYRAPEVILGAGWTYSVDIWNLGLLMWNFLESRDLFTLAVDGEGEYRPAAHLAEMIALFGPLPKELLDCEREGLRWKWAPAAHNSEAKLCNTASEWYGGLFFDENGDFLYKVLIPSDLRLEDTVTCLSGEQKAQFLSFARKMLQWLPSDRNAAKELIEDPWLSEELIKRS